MSFGVLVFAAALAARLAVVVWLRDTVPYSDFVLYHVVGREIAHDPAFLFHRNVPHLLPQTQWWPPGYAVFLALVYLVAGDHFRNAVYAQALLGAGTAWLAYRIGRDAAGENTGRAAGLLVAFNPHHVFLTNQLASENLFVFLLALGLWMWMWMRAGRPRAVLAAGVVMGVGAWTRAVGLLVPLVAAAWELRRDCGLGRRTGGLRRRAAVLLLAGTAIVLAPWAVRNAVLLGSPAPLSFGGGLNFYYGHNAAGIGYRDIATTPLPREAGPAAVDRDGYRRGLEFMLRHPGTELRNTARKLVAFFAPPDYALHVNSGILIPDTRARPDLEAEAAARLERQRRRDALLHGPWTDVARIFHFALLLGVAVALMQWRRLPPMLRFLTWLSAAWVLVHVVVFWAQPRFRYPVELLWAVLAGYALVRAGERARPGTSSADSPEAPDPPGRPLVPPHPSD